MTIVVTCDGPGAVPCMVPGRLIFERTTHNEVTGELIDRGWGFVRSTGIERCPVCNDMFLKANYGGNVVSTIALPGAAL